MIGFSFTFTVHEGEFSEVSNNKNNNIQIQLKILL